MNRRSFITRAATAMALTAFPTGALAQSTTPEARWDDASQLFGNAWDLLPQAPDGEIAIVSLTLDSSGPTFGMSTILGLIHNNTDDERAVATVSTDISGMVMFGTMQEKIAPHAYSLLNISLEAELAPEDALPEITATFASHEDAIEQIGYSVRNNPVRVDSAELTAESLLTTLTNDSEDDFPEGILYGMIAFFQKDGTITDGVALGELTALASGETIDAENYLFLDFDPAATFLVGYYGYPE